ncbi:unnamed protein product [Hymenolepis diminuta]|uniref:Uncharacterized protein n=1 Tax=Hymenolepis diminuta TaxID=6216 RepID=A0A0R3SWL6_HYMDI|nr:unnamed protein product [Hymenolepis diminuta]
MIEERTLYAAVSTPNSGVLVIGGIGRSKLPLHSTKLLTRRCGEIKGEGVGQCRLKASRRKRSECCAFAVFRPTPLSKPPFYEYVYALHDEIVDNVRRVLNSRKFPGIENLKQ